MNVCEKLEEKFQNADIEKKNMKRNLIKEKIRILRSWTSPKEGGHNISKPCNTSKTSSRCKNKS